MHHDKFSFSRLFSGGLFFTFLTILFAGCDKDENKPPPTAPVVETAALTNITSSGATAGGSIVTDGGAPVTASGIVWSQANATPTIADTTIAVIATSGAFTVNVTGIDFGNTYYLRAFATNSAGTGYGDVVILTTSNDSVRFTYNGETVTYGIITSPTTGKKWLDRNIGAQRQAIAVDDYQAYGDLFQWGRPADGHQLINWASSSTGTGVNGIIEGQATTDVPGHSNFITITANPLDWRDDNNMNRWITNPQGPCPAGWHVPTVMEWKAEVSTTIPGGTATTGGINNMAQAYSLFKLTTAGRRHAYTIPGLFTAGSIRILNSAGELTAIYSSSSGSQPSGYFAPDIFSFGNGGGTAGFSNGQACEGYSVRCIKD